MKTNTNFRPLKCLLVEDEQNDIDIISQYIDNHERLEYVGATIDIIDFSRIVGSEKIDIIFLDNELGRAPHQRNQGLAFFETLINLTKINPTNPLPYVISISQYSEDYQKAIDLNVWGVISKPILEENFKTKVNRVIGIIDDKEEIKRYQENSKKNQFAPLGRIAIKEKGISKIYKFIDLSNIVYIESVPNNHEVKIHLSEPSGEFILTTNTLFTTLDGFLLGIINENKNLSAKQLQFFGKIKKNCVINLCYINNVEADTINLKNIDKPLSFGGTEFRKTIMAKFKEIFSN